MLVVTHYQTTNFNLTTTVVELPVDGLGILCVLGRLI